MHSNQEWNSLPDVRMCIKNLTAEYLAMFGFTYFCEQLFLTMIDREWSKRISLENKWGITTDNQKIIISKAATNFALIWNGCFCLFTRNFFFLLLIDASDKYIKLFLFLNYSIEIFYPRLLITQPVA